ncbi:helix-turn-helix domain-containing protein [Zavarzinia compransoris]|uniref:IclR family transcriptional regulator n=1 Tax=Zavarzinia marina TaxID=2911065 RepID=UPI001F2F475A|nr:helix-turn-helix domain-containing protein [Zavarzinia marina]MCF4166102.1 helix-turn-helix domain-containing protein [Zavarzinia marina]
MSSLDRMLRILELFAAERPRWTVEQAIARTGYSRSTIYRYFKSLSGAGLVSAGADGAYSLGPAVIGLDRLIRLYDPLLVAGGPQITELARATGLVAVVESFRDQVVVTHVETAPDTIAPDTAAPDRAAAAGLQRGLSAGMLDSAAARVLLACENARRLRRFYDVSAPAVARAGLGADWGAFRQSLRVQRRVGFAVHAGEGPLGHLRVAVPVFGEGERVVAALAAPAAERDEARIGEILLRAARRISTRIRDYVPPEDDEETAEAASWRPSAPVGSGAAPITAERFRLA